MYERAADYAESIKISFIDDKSGVVHPPIPGVEIEIVLTAISHLAKVKEHQDKIRKEL